jgi:hypothetical protein
MSIHPANGSSSQHEEECKAFRRQITDLNGEQFAAVLKEVGLLMVHSFLM